jgi:hypothetical protein
MTLAWLAKFYLSKMTWFVIVIFDSVENCVIAAGSIIAPPVSHACY